MGDPILELYQQLLSFDMLEDKYSNDYDTFVSDMGDAGTRKALYDYLEQEGRGKIDVDIDYGEFDRRFAPSAALLEKAKKKSQSSPESDAGSLGDIQVDAPARGAAFSIINHSTRLRDPKEAVPSFLTGEEDPLAYGNLLRQKAEKDYNAKEERANKWAMWRGERDLETIALFAKEARLQLDQSDEILAGKYGADWKDRLQTINEIQADGPQNAQEVEYLKEAQLDFAGLTSDESFQRYNAAANAMRRAEGSWDEYGKKNPEWARLMAKKQYAQATADNSAPWWQSTESEGVESWGWLGRKSRKVVGGILSLPRTLFGAIGNSSLAALSNPVTGAVAYGGAKLAKDSFAHKWANDLGDWSDKFVEEAALSMPAPTRYARPMFENVVRFQGMDVVVDDKGFPQVAYSPGTGNAVELDRETARNFVNSGAAANAEIRFTGYGNAGYKLADIVADLYLMRAAGQGSSIGSSLAAFTLNHQDLYNTAVADLKYSGDDAAQFALVAGGLNAVIESTVGKIETNGVRLAAARQVGLQEARAVAGKMTPYDVAKVYATAFGRELALENVEELLQTGSESGTKMLFNAMTGGTLDASIRPEEVAEVIILTTLATGTAGGADIAQNGKSQFYEMALNMAAQNPSAMNNALTQLYEQGVLSEEELNAQADRISELGVIANNLPPGATQEQRSQVIILEDRKMAVRDILATNPSSAAQDLLKQTEKQIDAEIQKILKEATAAGTASPQNQNQSATPQQQSQGNAVQGATQAANTAQQQNAQGQGVSMGAQTQTAQGVNSPQAQASPQSVLPPVSTAPKQQSAQSQGQQGSAQNPNMGNAPTPTGVSAQADIIVSDEQEAQEERAKANEEIAQSLLDVMPATDYLGDRRVSGQGAAAMQVETTMGDLAGMRGLTNTQDNADARAQIATLQNQLASAAGSEAQQIEDQIGALQIRLQGNEERANMAREGMVDDLVNTSLGLMLPSERSTVLSTPGALQQLRAYTSDRMSDMDDSMRVLDVAQNIADEYRYAIQDQPSGRRGELGGFEPANVDEHIALAFAEGMRLRIEDTGDVTDMRAMGGMRLQYTSRNGTGLDMMADTIRRNMGLDDFADMRSVDIQNSILDFMHRNPNGPWEYIRAEKGRRLQQEEEYLSGVEMEVVQAVSDIQDQLSPETDGELQTLFAAYTDSEGNLDTERLLDDWENFDPFDAPDSPLAQLSYETYKILDEKINELKELDAPVAVRQGSIPEEVNSTTEPAETGSIEESAQGDPDFTTPQGAEQAVEIAATTPFINEYEAATQEILDNVELPGEADAYMIRELVLEGHLSQQEGILAMAALNGDERGAKALEKANGMIDELRRVGNNEPLVQRVEEDGKAVFGEFKVQDLGGGLFRIYNAPAHADLLRSVNATFDAATNTWTVQADSMAAVGAILTKQSSSAKKDRDELTTTVQFGGMAKATLLTPGALLRRIKTKRRLAAARTLDEQLAVMQNEFGIDQNKDRRALNKMIKRLSKAFPGITIVSEAGEIDKVKKEAGITGNVLGFTRNGIVYIDPRVARADTPMHEFGHLWNTWMKSKKPALYNEGIELARNSELYGIISQDEMYQGLSEEEIAEEALAAAIGQQGALFGNSSMVLTFKDFYARMWRGIKGVFGFDVRYKSLTEFADAQAAQMLKGGLRETSAQMAAIEQAGTVFRAQYGGKEAVKRRLDHAFEMEAMGMTTEEIAYATNFSRRADGMWTLDVRNPYVFRADNMQAGQGGVLGDVLSAPDLFAVFPQAAQTDVEIVDGQTHFKDGVLFLYKNAGNNDLDLSMAVAEAVSSSLNLSGAYVNTLTAQAEADVLEHRARGDAKDESGISRLYEVAPAVSSGLLGQTPVRMQGAVASVDTAARIAAVEQIIENEIRREGMRGVLEKVAKIAKSSGLDEGHVARIWEQQAKRVGSGKITLTNKPETEAQYKTELDRIIAEYRRRGKVFAKEYFAVGGLLPSGIRALDEQRINNTARHMKEAQILLKSLEKSMKDYYGKHLTDAHWEMVNNVLTGEGNYSMLPDKIRDAAIAVRQKQDILSEQLVRSGVMRGDIILTVLNNAGVAVSHETLQDYDGVNVLEALGKLPFERSVSEEQAIDNLLKTRVRALGNYMYRSYRTHDDKEGWSLKVPPRVIEEAKEFLRRNIRQRVHEMEDLRDNTLDSINEEISQLKEKIDAQLLLLDERIKMQEEKVGRLAKKNDPRAAAWFENASKKLEALKAERRDGNTAMYAEVEALLSLNETDMSALEASTRRIIGYRQKIRELRIKHDEIAALSEEEMAAEMDRLNSVDAIIYEELHRGIEDDMGSMLSRGKLGSKDKKALTAREVIAPEIRALKGEYTDPRVNFAKSVFRTATLLENQRFLEAMKRDFAGVYFIPPNEFREGWIPISAEGSASMEPLAGWKAPREIVRAMNKYFQSQQLGSSVLGRLMEGLLSIQSMVKYGKTILSPVTHARNVTSNVMFVVANGWNPVVDNLGATARSAFEGLLNENEKDYILRLTELGVLGSGVSIGAIRQTLRDLNLSDPDKYIRDRIMKPITTVQKALELSYQFEDDMFRVIGFENEKGRYAKHWYGKRFDELAPAQQREVEERAAEIVKNVLPTFSKVPQIMKEINRVPLVGTFVFFVSESYRVAYNQWALAFQEINDPRTRSLGIGRAIGAGFAQAGLSAIVAAVNQFVHGIGYEEEREARKLMLPWQKDAPILYLGQQKGKEVSFLNLGYTDPYSAMKRPIYSFVYGQGNTGQRLSRSAYDFIEPFAAPELTLWTFTQLAVNHDAEKDRKIYSPRLGMLGDKSSYRFAARQLQPGFVKFFVDMYMAYTQKSVMGKAPKKPIDIWMGMTGLQAERMDIPKAVNGAVTKLKKQKEYSREIFLDSKWIYERGEDQQGLKKLFAAATNEYNDVMKEGKDIRKAALAMGMSPAAFDQLLKDQNFNNDEISAIKTGSKIIPTFEGFNKKKKKKKK